VPPVTTPEGQLSDPDALPALGPTAAIPAWAKTKRGSSLALALSRIVERPHLILLAGVLVAVALNLWETREQTFFSDEWGRFMFYRSNSLESLLRGYSGHLVVLHVLLYKGLFGAFGADSYLPFRIVEALLIGTCGLLFYALARSRAGAWPCVLATLVLLFLGSAVEVMATPYGIVILLPVALGLAALVCLQRFPGRGDLLACLLLIAAAASQSAGLAFVAGGAVVLALQSGRRRFLARSWVVLVPALLYVAWFAWSRLTSATGAAEPAHLHNLGLVPSTIVAVCAAGLSAISGFFGASGPAAGVSFNLEAGYLLLGLLVIGAIWRAQSGSPPARAVWVPVVLALTFWALLGMVASPDRPPTATRYIYPSAVFLLLIGLEFTRRIRPTLWVALVGVGAVLVSLVPNVVNLHEEARQIRAFAADERVELGALELLRSEVPGASFPGLTLKAGVLSVGGQGFPIAAATYFAAVDRYGSPAAGPEQIAAAGESPRQAADRLLLKAGDLTLSSRPGGSAGGHDCRRAFGPSIPYGRLFGVPAAGLDIRPHGSRSDVTILARRFATGFQRLTVPAGSGPLVLRPAATQAARPWTARIIGATVCTMG
jgi:hypothetical protein